jgi:hypothetical protein
MLVKILTPWMCKKAIKFDPIITEYRIPSDTRMDTICLLIQRFRYQKMCCYNQRWTAPTAFLINGAGVELPITGYNYDKYITIDRLMIENTTLDDISREFFQIYQR